MGKIQGVVTDITPLTDRIRRITLAAADGAPLPGWQAGAHIECDTAGGMRAYSLVSFDPVPDAPAHYVIAVQLEEAGTGGSHAMHQLNTGEALTFTTPQSSFAVDPTAPAVLLAGGIGITPLISMATALKQAEQPVTLHYAGRSADVMAYRAALAAHWGRAFHPHYDDDPSSALDIDALIASLGQAHLYICGPRGMLDAVRTKAEAAGLPAHRLHVEVFETAKTQASDSAFEVQINDGRVFTIPPDHSIIDVLEQNDVDVMYDCQRGDCGICQVDVIDGLPDHRDVVLSASERAAGDVMQICVSRAISARLVLDI